MMENNIDISQDYTLEEIQFENPLKNKLFLYYLTHNNVPYDFNKLYNDTSYSQALYDDYFDHLILEYYRPKFPPIVNVEEYVNENGKNKKIKDMSKMNKGNGFMVYRKNLNKHLETLGVRISMQQLSPLAGSLWKSEPKDVKDYYKELSEEIKKLHNNRVENYIKNNRKRSSEDDNGKISHKKIKDMTTKNGGNAFIIFRKQLNEYLRSLGYNFSMQEHSKIASIVWNRQPKEVKSHFKELSGQFKKTLNDQLKQMFYKSDNDNNEPIIDYGPLSNIKSDSDNNGPISPLSHIKSDNDNNGSIIDYDSSSYIKPDNNNNEPVIDYNFLSYIKPDNNNNEAIIDYDFLSYIKSDNDASANDAHDHYDNSCMGESKPYGSS